MPTPNAEAQRTQRAAEKKRGNHGAHGGHREKTEKAQSAKAEAVRMTDGVEREKAKGWREPPSPSTGEGQG